MPPMNSLLRLLSIPSLTFYEIVGAARVEWIVRLAFTDRLLPRNRNRYLFPLTMVRRPRCMNHHFSTQFFRPAQLPLTLLKAVKDQNMASRFDTSHRPHHARHAPHTITDGRAQERRLIQRHPLSHRSPHEPPSQRRHLDISGWSKVLEGAHCLLLPPFI
jgi:hypothetical protein